MGMGLHTCWHRVQSLQNLAEEDVHLTRGPPDLEFKTVKAGLQSIKKATELSTIGDFGQLVPRQEHQQVRQACFPRAVQKLCYRCDFTSFYVCLLSPLWHPRVGHLDEGVGLVQLQPRGRHEPGPHPDALHVQEQLGHARLPHGIGGDQPRVLVQELVRLDGLQLGVGLAKLPLLDRVGRYFLHMIFRAKMWLNLKKYSNWVIKH